MLLASGCASNPNLTTEQMTDNQSRLAPIARHHIPAAIPKQASSVSTLEGAEGSSYQTLQNARNIPEENSSWLDRFIRDHVPYRSQSSPPSPKPRTFAETADNENQVLNLVNMARANAGLPPLSESSRLTDMALTKAQEMDSRNYFSHYSPTFGSPFDMMASFGIDYRSAGENIAQGQASPAEVVEQWMSSPQHRSNILNRSYSLVGIAYYNGKWVQEFVG
ncbi:SCP-like extracellular [Cohnella thailandensis]|uniref:SCP-like extracellular n=2 Tax=Cohnella thailandensis TaxID=557557 RepID=A0A841T4J4_9BACL|nr:SCP-like extracellular [Cohnella thailandensis]